MFKVCDTCLRKMSDVYINLKLKMIEETKENFYCFHEYKKIKK